MFCVQCGKQIQDGAKFCPACGANLQGDARADAQPAGGGSLKFVIAGIVMAAAAGAGYFVFWPTPLEKPAAVAPRPAVEAVAPEPKAPEPSTPEKPPEPPAPAVAEPQRPDPAALEAAHKALDQRIADEEAAAKQGAAKK